MSSESTSSDPFRVGVVGLGWLGTELALQCRAHEAATVSALADVDATARTELGERLGVPVGARYDDAAAMMTDEPLDAVVIATPHAYHYDQLSVAFEHELDVLCEKPLCIDLERARELGSHAAAAGSTVMLGYQRHLNAPFRAARKRLREAPGSIQYVDASVTQPWTEIGGWRTNPDLSGGGVLFDTGNHLLDGVLWTTALVPEAVTAEMVYDDDTERVDVAASLNVAFENGAVGSISIDGTAPRYTEHNRVWTENGVVSFTEDELRTVDADGNEYRPNVDRGAERNKVEAFLEAVETGEDPPATIDHAVRSIALTEAAYEAARTGERVDVEL